MRGPGIALLAAALAGIPATEPLRAEIRLHVRDGEVVATNLGAARRLSTLREGARSAATAASGEIVPAAPLATQQILSGSAVRYGFDPALIHAIVAAESAFDNLAVSKKGARGLMQIMPATARERGVRNAHDPSSNVEAGVAYLRELVQRFHGDMTLAIAAYNAGPEAVARYGGVPPYGETRRYIERIKGYYGEDLGAGDWSVYPGGIRLARIEAGGVPHFTNVRSRRAAKIGPRAEPSAGQSR